MSFLIDKYKGKYKLLAPFDKRTNQFPRKLNGTFEDIDVYIACKKDIQIYYYGKSILDVYVPSKLKGKNIIKQIESEFGKTILFDIYYTDEECCFKFKAKYMEQLEKYLQPKTISCQRSPFSSKNLPQNKDYKIPDEDFIKYKNIIDFIPQKRVLELTHITSRYLKSLVSKTNSWNEIKADMSQKMLKGKEYIHSIGKWDDYIEYLKTNLESMDED